MSVGNSYSPHNPRPLINSTFDFPLACNSRVFPRVLIKQASKRGIRTQFSLACKSANDRLLNPVSYEDSAIDIVYCVGSVEITTRNIKGWCTVDIQKARSNVASEGPLSRFPQTKGLHVIPCFQFPHIGSTPTCLLMKILSGLQSGIVSQKCRIEVNLYSVTVCSNLFQVNMLPNPDYSMATPRKIPW